MSRAFREEKEGRQGSAGREVTEDELKKKKKKVEKEGNLRGTELEA